MTSDTLNSEELNDQANENDVDLRTLVYQSLERDGLITRLKAQLRAAVFKTIEKASTSSGETSSKPVYDSPHGRLALALITDWLEHMKFLYTDDIFQVEAGGVKPIDRKTAIEQLNFSSTDIDSRPLLDVLINRKENQPTKLTALPEHVQQSIDSKFPTEKINDLNRVREHFRSLFMSAFDTTVLDAYLDKALPALSTSIPKFQYEQICLKWMQSCAQALTVPLTTTSNVPVTTHVTKIKPTLVTRARRDLTGVSDSSSSSESSGHDDFDLMLPMTSNKKPIDNSSLPKLNFNKNNGKTLSNGNKDLVIEYDEESLSQSQSQISSVDDVTVDKASPSASAPIDYLEDV